MGCCASTTTNPPSDPQFHRHSSLLKSNREPPPPPPPPPLPLIEEVTIKEVLSETPKPKSKIPKIEDEPNKQNLEKIYEEQGKRYENKKPKIITAEEISEISEICSNLSLSESVSISTTTLTAKRDDDDGEVRQRVDRSPAKFRNRSFSGDLSSRRERVVGKSPAKRSDQSRGRVKSVPGVERRGFVAGGTRSESGESSVRRSRSPATRTEAGGTRFGPGRSQSTRKVGNSPGRVKPEPVGKNRKPEEGKLNSPAATDESLENPLVSLECFIFL